MFFLVTMNMPVRIREGQGSPQLVHQMIVKINGVVNIREFYSLIQKMDFLLVTEFYKNESGGGYREISEIIINTNVIGKIKSVDAGSAERSKRDY